MLDTFGIGGGNIGAPGSYWPAFLAAAVTGLFTCYGFEACGDVAEETPNPGVAIPRAMRMTIYIGMAAAAFVCLALIVAQPDMQGAISGNVADPVAAVLLGAFGPVGFKVVICVVLVSFMSCILSLQAATSRLVFAYARDKMVAASEALSKISEHTHVPVRALVLSGVIAAIIICLGLIFANAIAIIVASAIIGIYAAFQMIVLGRAGGTHAGMDARRQIPARRVGPIRSTSLR
ncbi:MAG: amino acid permease [Rhizomicrobium sp.]